MPIKKFFHTTPKNNASNGLKESSPLLANPQEYVVYITNITVILPRQT